MAAVDKMAQVVVRTALTRGGVVRRQCGQLALRGRAAADGGTHIANRDPQQIALRIEVQADAGNQLVILDEGRVVAFRGDLAHHACVNGAHEEYFLRRRPGNAFGVGLFGGEGNVASGQRHTTAP